uniref:NYN domain-containing protein n=1 Tax=Tetranychus urticae TaxID=32264 RepID=T1KGG2_TETUR
MFNRLKKPCGIFWDIENVSVPKTCSADVIAQNIRTNIVMPNELKEREFFCVCNVQKLPKVVGNTLESIGVTIVQPFYHVKENAADTKILFLITKFIADWGSNGCAIVVVTGDSDFIDTLINLKLNYDLKVYLVHPKNSFSKELLWCADESYCLNNFLLVESTPTSALRGSPNSSFIKISDLPQISTGQFMVREIEKRCQKFCPGSRVLRITKGAVLIGYAGSTDRPMNERDLSHFDGFRVFGNLLKAELVNSLWTNSSPKVEHNVPKSEPNLELIRKSVQISYGKKVFQGHQNKRFKPYPRPHPQPHPQPPPREAPKKLLYVKVTGFKDCKSGSPLIYGLSEFNSRFIRLYGQDVWLSFTEASEAEFAIDKICTYELDGSKLTAKLEESPPEDLLSNSTCFTDDGPENDLDNPPMTNAPSSSSSSSNGSTSYQQFRSSQGARRILIQTTNDQLPRDRPTLVDLTDTPPARPNRIRVNPSTDFIPIVDLTKDET